MLRFVSFLLLMILEVHSLGVIGSKSKICKIKCENSVCEIYCPTSNGIVRSQCDSNPFCLYDFCIKNRQDYCPCGGYTDDQFEECYPECKINSECPPQLACINKECVNPCRGSCGRNATCDVIHHNPICHCADGLVGDPFISCHSKNIRRETYTQGGRISGIKKLNNTVVFFVSAKRSGQSFTMHVGDVPIVLMVYDIRDDIHGDCTGTCTINAITNLLPFCNVINIPGSRHLHILIQNRAEKIYTGSWLCNFRTRGPTTLEQPIEFFNFDMVVKDVDMTTMPALPSIDDAKSSRSLMTILIITCSVTLIVILIISAITVWRKMDCRIPGMDYDNNIYEEVYYTAQPAGASSEPAPRPACPLPEGTESREYVYDIVYESRVRRLWEARWFAHKRSERAEEIRRLAAGVPRPRV